MATHDNLTLTDFPESRHDVLKTTPGHALLFEILKVASASILPDCFYYVAQTHSSKIVIPVFAEIK